VNVGDLLCVREALLYESLPGRVVRCGSCERRCKIYLNSRGFCGSRENRGGKLYSLTYGDLSTINVSPIEKKPMFHFWPGSKALSAGSWGCSLKCIYCQNHFLSMTFPNPERCGYVSPENFVTLALRKDVQGISFTYNEASSTLFEYMVDCFRISKKHGLYCNLNTNGYMTLDVLRILIKAGLDSLCVDIKGDDFFYQRFCNGADVKIVWRNSVEAMKRGVYVEVVNLIIPRGNDSSEVIEDIIKRTRLELSSDTPLHFTRFYPVYKAKDYGLERVTPVKTLERVRKKAIEEGLKYVYIGNVPGHSGENTYCFNCGSLLIQRHFFSVLKYRITEDSRCPDCGQRIMMLGKFIS
jgi:pyruvate formate lyase activating enzyme